MKQYQNLTKCKSHSAIWLERSGGSNHRSWGPERNKSYWAKAWATVTSYRGAGTCGFLQICQKLRHFARRRGYYQHLKDSKDWLEDGRTANTKVDWATIHTKFPEVYCKSDKASLRHSLCEQFQDSVELNPNISETIDSYFQFKYRKKSNRVSHMYT